MSVDVITLLTTDHREVDGLLNDLLAGKVTGDDRAQAISTIVRELSMHAAAEEMVLYPELRDLLPDGDQLADEALSEHQNIKEVLNDLDGKSPDDPGVMEAIASVATEVRHHVEEEEGELFVKLRDSASPDRLMELGDLIERAKKAAPTHPHPNAPNTPPGNMILGPPTALFDRMRDAISNR